MFIVCVLEKKKKYEYAGFFLEKKEKKKNKFNCFKEYNILWTVFLIYIYMYIFYNLITHDIDAL